MSFLSSPFSSMPPNNPKNYNPPKPSFKSPKLVQEPSHATSPSQDLSRVAHPFASFRSTPSPPEQNFKRPVNPPAVPPRPRIPSISEFGSFHSSHDYADLIKRQASQQTHDSEPGPQARARSNTVGSQHSFAPDCSPVDDFLPSPNPIKSQFDDSDDEEKLDFAHHSLSGVSTRARLAAIGTASRLFKSKRHSRTPSSSVTAKPSSHEKEVSLQLERRSSHLRDAPACRPNTSDGMSPNPRQAVFGHRPSPSEVGLVSSRESSRSVVAPADRDLILGLQGGAPKLRTKSTDKKKSLPRPPAQPPASHHRQASVNISPPFTDVKMHWADPPPYCSPTETELGRSDSLRKSQSLSTLRFGFNRRPGSASPAPQAAYPRGSEHEPSSAHGKVEQSTWDAIVTTSPSTVSDHGSGYGGARTARSDASHTSPGKRIKAQRLPPQKPPPQTSLPPPPPPQQSTVDTKQVGSAKSSFETNLSCPSLSGDSAGAGSTSSHDREKTLERPNSVKTSLEVSTKSSDSSSPRDLAEHASSPLVNRAQPLQQHSQVVLDVGGTKFVTLVSTLQGAAGDQPRLLDLLQRQQADANTGPDAALCNNAQLTRRQPVEGSNRNGAGEQRDLHKSPQGLQLDIGWAQQVESQLDGEVASKSNTSLSTSRSGSVSHGESEASTRRTSDTSDASSWSKHTSEPEATAASSSTPGDTHPSDTNDYNTALPSSRLCSPTHCPSSPPSPLSSPSSHSLFIDRNGDLYRDILDILRTRKLPYRLQASCLGPSHNKDDDRSGMAALKLQLRCRLFEVKDEAEWLGYPSIVGMCEGEIARV
ncbi:conserved hypothetical protein [Sporisorium reilianum SRZ2]|uniref:Uncharacterized protein n=1 Tax=Sporisorium reilianum (strain SRZ2) TaxID=999809 RepID=E6ZQ64_SPORE|nr:conserved hypothetical protein [Sporisorium reilianum SRZ2]